MNDSAVEPAAKSRLLPAWDSLAVFLYLSVGSVALFFVALGSYFFADDFVWMHIGHFDMGTPPGWLHAFTTQVSEGYRPLSQAVFFWLGTRLFGFHPLGYHILNLCALVLAATLIYRTLTNTPAGKSAGLVAAVFFAFSAIHYDSATWASTFSENGATAAFCAAFYFFMSGKQRSAVFWYIVALLCDESSIPLVAVAFAAAVLLDRSTIWSALVRCKGLIAALTGYTLFRIFVVGFHVRSAGPYQFHASAITYWPLIQRTILDCFGWTAVAENAASSSVITSGLFSAAFLVLAALWLVSSIAYLQRGGRTRFARAAGFGLFWFLATLTPMLVFAANNWSYYNEAIPLIGIALIVAAPFQEHPRFTMAAVGATLVVGAIAALSIYSPGGWNAIDGIRIGAESNRAFYGWIEREYARTGKVPNLGVVAPAANLRTVTVQTGRNRGVSVILNDPTASRITYASVPPQNADVIFTWSAQGLAPPSFPHGRL